MVLGLDAGGTSTRCLVVDAGGRVHGRARAGGGNPISRPVAEATEQVALAVGGALAQVDAGLVRTAVLGVAGYGNHPETIGTLSAALDRAGLRCPVRVCGDAEIAFAAGTPAREGTVLIAGTGATACRVVDGGEGPTHDGWGWLLGDEGSGFWIGREAVRVMLHDAERGLAGPLATAVSQAVAGGWVSGPDLILRVHARPPVALAELAPLVLDAAAAGDVQAGEIVRRAVELLVASVSEIRAPGEQTPVVLAGGIASSAGVGGPLAAALHERWPTASLRTVTSSEAGAVWLAARQQWPGLPETVHERLCRPRLLAG
nr:BadF/BadG/BcrA/BcrD ATPase family protein [Auraticoccus cholistanensis]